MFNPENPFTLRYNPGTPEGDVVTGAGWVSGSCFLARRSALEELGGFDEAYFMYNEDMDLCWRAHDAGWGVGFAGTAEVTHVQGHQHGAAPVSHDGGPSPLGPPLHLPDHQGLAPRRVAAGSLGARGAPGHGHRPHRRQPLARCAGHRGLLIVALVAIGITVLVLVAGGGRQRPDAQSRHRVHVEPQVTFALPPAATSCNGATAEAGGGEKVPLTVSVVAGQVAETVDVCIGNQGPYPFILDTGAGQSTIDAGLAHRLHLATRRCGHRVRRRRMHRHRTARRGGRLVARRGSAGRRSS